MSGSWIEGVGGMTRTLLAFPLLLTLAACSHKPEPIVRTVTVFKPVAVTCVPATLDPAPTYPDTDEALRAAVDAAERYALVAAGRLLRNARLAELEPVIQSCREVAK